MKVPAMRAVDRFAGIPLCWMTGLWHRVRGTRAPTPADQAAPILVMKFFGMGSVLLSTPLLDALRQNFPAAPLWYLTFAVNGDLLNRLPQPAVRLTIDTGSPFRFLADTVRVLAHIRRSKPRMVFDLEFFSKFSTAIAALAGAPVRIGFALPTRWRSWNITHPVELDHAHHVTGVFLRQLESVGVSPSASPPVTRLRATEEDRLQLREILSDDASPPIVVNINAGATSLERRWPAQLFVDVVRHLHRERGGRTFFFTGLAAERAYVAQALAPHSDLAGVTVNCAGRLGIGTLIALLERAALCITNDSGPMHIASSVGTPLVALFGPESPALYGPMGRAKTIAKILPCSPCLTVYNAKLFVCPFDARCMKEITVSEVLAAARALLPAVPAGAR